MNTDKETILLVEDDENFREIIRDYLQAHGYEVSESGNGQAMWAYLATHQADLIVLDVMLPGEDGISLLQNLHAQTPSQAVIMLSNLGEEEVERVIGLEMGADDFLPKSTGPRELLAHVRAVLRRKNKAPSSPSYQFGDFIVDVDRRSVIKDGEELQLTSLEFSLLQILITESGRIFAREELSRRLKGYGSDSLDRTVDVIVQRLRSKIESDTKHPQFIRTVRGRGYMFAA